MPKRIEEVHVFKGYYRRQLLCVRFLMQSGSACVKGDLLNVKADTFMELAKAYIVSKQ